MNNIKFLFFTFILFNTTALKAAESIVAGVNGMFCIACQEKLSKAFSEKFGTDATITVSWEQGLAVVSVPTKGKITEEDFKNVVLETGFEFEGIKKVAKPIRNLKETEAFIKENPGVLILKLFKSVINNIFLYHKQSHADRKTDRMVTNGLQQATKLPIRELSFNNQIF